MFNSTYLVAIRWDDLRIGIWLGKDLWISDPTKWDVSFLQYKRTSVAEYAYNIIVMFLVIIFLAFSNTLHLCLLTALECESTKCYETVFQSEKKKLIFDNTFYDFAEQVCGTARLTCRHNICPWIYLYTYTGKITGIYNKCCCSVCTTRTLLREPVKQILHVEVVRTTTVVIGREGWKP